jgi:MinD-like ATPase involved in chromosome partitioning or flagellar assembly
LNERGLVEVPENAIRDEPIAFGLTGVQLGVCGAGVLLAAALNLLPIWEPFRVVVVILVAGPVFVAAALRVRGEPAYRWLVRAGRYWRGRRTWTAVLAGADKPRISDECETDVLPAAAWDAPGEPAWQGEEKRDTAGPRETPAARPSDVGTAAPVPTRMRHEPVRLKLVQPTLDGGDAPSAAPPGEAAERPPVVPHVLPGLRVVCLLSFVGGTGRTTLAVEAATLVAQRARYQTMDGEELPVQVLLVDANRLASAVGLRLGLSPRALSSAWLPRFWLEPSAVAELAVDTTAGPRVLTLPPHHQLSASELRPATDPPVFGALAARAIVDGARHAGYQLLIADLAASLEEGHRELIDLADVVIGIVRPTVESVAEPFRLAEVLRHMDAGRKLVLVANMADDDQPVRQWAAEAGLSVAARVGRNAAFDEAGESGAPAWQSHPAVEAEVAAVARIAWPILGTAPKPRVGMLASLRGERR